MKNEELKQFIEENKGILNKEGAKSILETLENNEPITNYMLAQCGIFECDDCGELHFIEDSYTTEDGYNLCPECHQYNTYTCDCCGKVYKYDYDFEETDDGEYYCPECAQGFSHCDDCGILITDERREYYARDTHQTYCSNCYCEHGAHCDDCGEFYENLEEIDGYYYCDDCVGEHIDHDKDIIHSYGYKPEPIFYKLENEKNEEFLGIELEIDDGNDFSVLKEVQELLNNLIYWKTDGSLNDGAEMVSYPCTIKKWLTLKDTMSNVFELLKNANFRSHDTSTCGLHIHVSRKSLGDTTEQQNAVIDRILLLTEVFKNELKKFSRRKNYHYCKFASESGSYYSESNMEDLEKCKRFKNNNYDRYLVLNNNNSNTIEFRVFRGTLNINTFFACLQFVHNICNIAKKRTIHKFDGIRWRDLINYTRDFKELKDYNKLRDIQSVKRVDIFKKQQKGGV